MPELFKRKKGSVKSLDRKKARSGWLFVLPFVIGLLVVYFPVLWDSLKYSFNSIKILQGGGYQLTFVGFKNFQDALFVDTSYVKTLVSGIQKLVLDIPAIVIFSLFIAVLLNEKMVGRTAFRAIFFVPVILATGLISNIDSNNVLLSQMGDVSSGINTGATSDVTSEIVNLTDISWLFSSMAVGNELVTYVTSLVNGIFTIINRSGVQMLIFLAGLQSISPAIYESCSIDGATAWETFWKITIPMISPMILVNSIYTVIDSFTSSDNAVMTYISQVYVKVGGNVLASAMSWMYFLLVLVIIGIVAAVLSAFVFYQRRD